MTNLKCPKCDGPMVHGFLLEKNKKESSQEVEIAATEWVAIDEEDFDKHATFKEEQIVERIPVETYRCYECGYLEFFAKTPLG